MTAACSALALACSGNSAWILQELDASPAAPADADGMDPGEPEPGAFDAGEPGPGVGWPVPDAGVGMPADGGTAIDGAVDAGAPLRDPESFAGACTPQIAIDNRTANGRGALFDQAFPMPGNAVRDIAKQVCALLYKVPEEVPPSPPIVLVIEDFYGIGEIGITAPVIYIRLSSLRMQSVAEAGASVRADVTGSLFYLLAIDYALDDENPGLVRWVTEGIAAFVRYRAGYTELAERRPGGSPFEDYRTTGFFFDWLDRTYPDAVYLLNQSLDPDDQVAWDESVFVEITGKDLATLWMDYQRSL